MAESTEAAGLKIEGTRGAENQSHGAERIAGAAYEPGAKAAKQAIKETSARQTKGLEATGELPRLELATGPRTPRLETEAEAATINGRLRRGSDVYKIQNGALHPMRMENGQEVVDEQSVGRLGPGYALELNGQKPLQLADERGVLMDFSVGGSTRRNQIVGLGAANTADGSNDPGGLVDIRALKKAGLQAEGAADRATSSYYAERPYVTGGLGNWAMGDREAELEQVGGNLHYQNQMLQKQADMLFDRGFDTNQVDSAKLDRAIDQTHLVAQSVGADSITSRELAIDGKHQQETVRDGVAMAATTVATAGIGGTVSAAAAAGRLGIVGAAATEVGAGAIAGSASRVAFGKSQESDDVRNAVSGAIEGATIAGGGRVARNAATIGAKAANAIAQGVGMNAAAAARTGESMSVEGVALGAAAMYAGNEVGTVAAKGLGRAAGALESSAGRSLGESAAKQLAVTENGLASSIVRDTADSFINGGVSATGSAVSKERERVASALNKPVDQLTAAEFYANADLGNIGSDMAKNGFASAATAPFMSTLVHPAARGMKSQLEEAAAGTPQGFDTTVDSRALNLDETQKIYSDAFHEADTRELPVLQEATVGDSSSTPEWMTFPDGKIAARRDGNWLEYYPAGHPRENEIPTWESGTYRQEPNGTIIKDNGIEEVRYLPDGSIEKTNSLEFLQVRDNVSPEFAEQVGEALQEVPIALREKVAANGTKVIVGSRVTDVATDLRGVPIGFTSPDQTAGLSMGVYRRDNNEVIVGEKFRHQDRALPLQTVENPKGVLFHEFGHALDEALGKVSESAEFRSAYEADLASSYNNLNPGEQKLIEYFARSTADGKADIRGLREGYAEMFAIIMGTGSNPRLSSTLRRGFPRVERLLRERLAEETAAG